MKHGRKPTVAQRAKLKSLPSPGNWLVSKNSPTEFVVEHRVSGEVRRLGS